MLGCRNRTANLSDTVPLGAAGGGASHFPACSFRVCSDGCFRRRICRKWPRPCWMGVRIAGRSRYLSGWARRTDRRSCIWPLSTLHSSARPILMGIRNVDFRGFLDWCIDCRLPGRTHWTRYRAIRHEWRWSLSTLRPIGTSPLSGERASGIERSGQARFKFICGAFECRGREGIKYACVQKLRLRY